MTSDITAEVKAAAQAASEDPVRAAMQALLKVEASFRDAATIVQLAHVIANESRKLIRARQVFVFTRNRHRDGFKVIAVSSVAVVDPNAPLVQLMEGLLGTIAASHDLASEQEFSLEAFLASAKQGPVGDGYPLRECLWQPLLARDGTIIGGLLAARETAWIERDIVIARRLASTAAHAWTALQPSARTRKAWTRGKIAAGVLAVAVLLALFVPVPMSALAPFEIIPRDAIVVAAPIDGAIKDVAVSPNARVEAGALLVKFADTTLRNQYEVAEREVTVAEAKLKRTGQMAFVDIEGRRQLAIARAERDVREAERDYARDLLAKSEVRAQVSAIAVFNDKKDLIGRPVKAGERLMELADPGKVWARIEMPVSDVAVLSPGADVKLFLDSDPLHTLRARLIRADYQAAVHHGDTVSFRAWAKLDLPSGQTPRLGVRGTAQVFGETVPLGIYLFRRPIAAARQWLGL